MPAMLTRLLACLLLLVATAASAGPECRPISSFDHYILHARGVVVGDMHGMSRHRHS